MAPDASVAGTLLLAASQPAAEGSPLDRPETKSRKGGQETAVPAWRHERCSGETLLFQSNDVNHDINIINVKYKIFYRKPLMN